MPVGEVIIAGSFGSVVDIAMAVLWPRRLSGVASRALVEWLSSNKRFNRCC